MYSTRVVAALAATLSLIGATSARAQLVPSVRAVAGTTITQQDSGTITAPPLNVFRQTSENKPDGSWAASSAKARPGELGGTVQLSIPGMPSSQQYGSITASTTSQFTDYVTVTGPQGGSVLLNFHFAVDGTYSVSNINRANVSYLTSLVISGQTVSGSATQQLNSGTGQVTGPSSFQLLVPVGERIRLAGNLQVSAGAPRGSGLAGGVYAEGLFGNTAHFYVDAADPSPEFQIVSDSGHVFSSAAAAPEPGTIALAAFGLLALPVRRVLRRRQSR